MINIILSKYVDVKITGKKVNYYKDLGYSCKVNEVVPISINHLTKGSNYDINLLCDYCLDDGKETEIKKPYYKYLKEREVVEKDACNNCGKRKARDVNLIIYGVEHHMSVPHIHEKVSSQRRLSYDFVKEEFFNKGLLLEEQEYHNASQKLNFRCIKHFDYGLQQVTYPGLKKGELCCVVCRGNAIGERCRLPLHKVKEIFLDRGYRLVTDKYVNNNTKLSYICIKHPQKVQYVTLSNLQSGCGCKECFFEKSYKGLAPLRILLRNRIGAWKRESVKNANGKCALTGENYEVIHHLYSFNSIVIDALNELNINLRCKISDYTFEEIEMLSDKVIELHNLHPLGVCLKKEVHSLFHSLYGYGNNTPEQFEQFKDEYMKDKMKEKIPS